MKAQLRANTDLHALAQVLAWFDQFNHSMIPHPVWLQCQLALAEGFTNAVRHAHRGQPNDTAIDIEVTISDGCLEIRIWDVGAGFDLEKTLAKLSQEVNYEAEGGRGLKLMKRMADVLTYTRTDDERNCLLVIKKF
ncbi:ATP-binding protein [Oscillatoria sp. FACHB-1407]|uniref:ATP-binding protein n=1 Tax=Oscillatoria sp. FACHB-1407 TaxID=2692847 RepID=UPI001F54BAB1|nr:anti-sigma regulatory factor [Oscillatoria sp. FACHB-1407]